MKLALTICLLTLCLAGYIVYDIGNVVAQRRLEQADFMAQCQMYKPRYECQYMWKRM